jgi:hypothetical protein
MKRLLQYKAKLKAAMAEETIRARQYNAAAKALKKVTNETIELQRKVENESAKLEEATSRTESAQ